LSTDAEQRPATLDFGGRVAIVTGAGQGLGRAYALTLAARGARVVVNDRNASLAESVATEIKAAGGTGIANFEDVVDGSAKIVAQASDAFGQLDIVINNAGTTDSTDLFESNDTELWWRNFFVHLRGTAEVCRAAWPLLVQSPAGRIINIVSGAMLGDRGLTSYGSAKGAIWGLTNSLAEEGRTHGLQVVAVSPVAWTPAMEAYDWNPEIASAFKKEFGPERVAAFVTWLAHQDTHVPHKAYTAGGGAAGALAFCGMPLVQAPVDTPEGWAQMADAVSADPASVPHVPFKDQGAMTGQNIAVVVPHLAELVNDDSVTAGTLEAALRRADRGKH
jgi:NAD(P)-dependent dehydrogenase (short-subunit alcohol dehydrogenase family)